MVCGLQTTHFYFWVNITFKVCDIISGTRDKRTCKNSLFPGFMTHSGGSECPKWKCVVRSCVAMTSAHTSCNRSPDCPSGQTCARQPGHRTGGGKAQLPPRKDLDPSWGGCRPARAGWHLQAHTQKNQKLFCFSNKILVISLQLSIWQPVWRFSCIPTAWWSEVDTMELPCWCTAEAGQLWNKSKMPPKKKKTKHTWIACSAFLPVIWAGIGSFSSSTVSNIFL